jgi:hypothetical protein
MLVCAHGTKLGYHVTKLAAYNMNCDRVLNIVKHSRSNFKCRSESSVKSSNQENADLLKYEFFVLCLFMGIKMDLLEIGVNVVDWIDLAQDRYRWRALVNSVMNLRVP